MKKNKNNSINSKSDKQLISILVVLNKLIAIYYKDHNGKRGYYNKRIDIIEYNVNNPKTIRWIGSKSDGCTIAKAIIETGVENKETGEDYIIKGEYTVYVKNIEKLEKLYQRLQERIGEIYKNRIKILFDNNKIIEWRCTECGRFLGKFTEKNQLINYLNDFNIYKFRACNKCRHKNHFSINKNGKIKFL